MNSDGEMRGSFRPAQRQTGNDSHSLCAHCGEPILPHEIQALLRRSQPMVALSGITMSVAFAARWEASDTCVENARTTA